MSGPEDANKPSAPPRRGAERPRRTPKARAKGAKPPTASPPPVRPAALDGKPPALRPKGADATIPLAPPDPVPPLHTPVPDGGRTKAARAAKTRRKAGRKPPAVKPLSPPPSVDVNADAPEPDRPTPLASAAAPLDGGPRLASDDEILELHESISPDLPLQGFGEHEGDGDAGSGDAGPWWRRWLAPPPTPSPGQATTRLSRHLAYEVIVVIVTFVIASILLFTSFDGEMRDVYIKGGELMGAYPAATSGEVTLVTVGDEALYLWDPTAPVPQVTPRGLLAELVHVLDEAGASVIVLDFLLETPQSDDPRLAEAAAAHGRVVAAERFVVTDPATATRFAPGPAVGLGADVSTGFANLGEEALWTSADERLVRSAHLVEVVDRARLASKWPASVGQEQGQAQVMPHMALLAAWRHRNPDAEPQALLAALQTGCTGAPLACTPSLEQLKLGPGPALTDRLAVNFRGPEHNDGLPTVRAAALLRLAGEPALYRQAGVERPLQVPPWLQEQVEGRIVVIGRVDATADDRFATPFGFPVPVRADMDGARIQAHTIDTLLTGRHVWRTPPWLGWMLAAGLLAGLIATARLLREDVHTALGLAAGFVLVGVGTVVFVATDGVVVDLALPLTTLLLGIVALRLRGWAVD